MNYSDAGIARLKEYLTENNEFEIDNDASRTPIMRLPANYLVKSSDNVVAFMFKPWQTGVVVYRNAGRNESDAAYMFPGKEHIELTARGVTLYEGSYVAFAKANDKLLRLTLARVSTPKPELAEVFYWPEDSDAEFLPIDTQDFIK